jgi:uncharacterized Zn-finger protein
MTEEWKIGPSQVKVQQSKLQQGVQKVLDLFCPKQDFGYIHVYDIEPKERIKCRYCGEFYL